ncbi:MAG: hypothetical protein C4523_05835 [Myxococcales bacterium]|nr:MAG: hypothetical protein C4523_05835 [Myxococcales bacterium]
MTEDQIEKRKKDHLALFRETALDDIDPRAAYAGHAFAAPVLIAGITGPFLKWQGQRLGYPIG